MVNPSSTSIVRGMIGSTGSSDNNVSWYGTLWRVTLPTAISTSTGRRSPNSEGLACLSAWVAPPSSKATSIPLSPSALTDFTYRVSSLIRTSLVLSNPEPDLDSTLNWFLLILLLLSFPYSCLFLGGFRFTFLGTFLSRRRPLLFSWNPSALKSSYPSLPSSLLTGSSELDNPSSGGPSMSRQNTWNVSPRIPIHVQTCIVHLGDIDLLRSPELTVCLPLPFLPTD